MIANHLSRCLMQEHRSFFKVRRAAKNYTRYQIQIKNLEAKKINKFIFTLKPSNRPWNVLEAQRKAGKVFYKNWHLWANRWMHVTNYVTFWGSSNLLHIFFSPLNVQLDFIFPFSCNKEALFNQPVWQNTLPVSLLLLPIQPLYTFCCFFPKGHYKQLLKQKMQPVYWTPTHYSMM